MDWLRLQKALTIEAERGFNDLEGNQHRFSEFLALTLREPPPDLPIVEQERLRAIAQEFSRYSDLTFAQRQHLVADTRRVIYQTRRTTEEQSQSASLEPDSAAADAGNEKATSATSTKTKVPKAVPLVEKNTRLTLDQAVTYLPGVGAKNAERLAKLGLHTVRDLLYYYPRDHIDYARQVNIRDLEPGETVTLIGTVKSCTIFNSPRNAKLAIFEMTVRDHTGQIKLSRFYAGARFRNRGWQEQQRRLYPPGAVVAASGLVKQSKYGKTLDDPQIEVIDHIGGSIESMKVGRVVPVYPLTEGVQADVLRKAVLGALPAVTQLQEALPNGLREKYGLVGIQEAIAHIHFPPEGESLAAARRRLVFDEFFYLQLGLLKRRQTQRQEQTSAVLAPTGKLIDEFYQILPFQLTGAQQRVVNDILN
ncbi:MAG: DNA helicase RecG, partial [Cyanobacteria bacterium J069]